MRLGQQVKVRGRRGPVTGQVGLVEDITWYKGRSWYWVRLPPPNHEVLLSFKVWELQRTK